MLRSWINVDNLTQGLSENPNPAAIKLLQKHPQLIDWELLSGNPNAIEMIKQNPDLIDWVRLSGNPNPEAIKLLKQNPEKINWNQLSRITQLL